MALRYIGSKARLVNEIASHLGPPSELGGFFVDAFCGTGSVSDAAARAGWPVRLNDHLQSAVTVAHARLVSCHEAKFVRLGGYAAAIESLNATRPFRGFVWREYSPASLKRAGVARMYFTPGNATRIDGIRRRIGEWRGGGLITAIEERLLIGDLLLAASRFANIAGTYGCFLSHWSPQSLNPLALRPRDLFPKQVKVETSVVDVKKVAVGSDDVVYLDPPYTKRQYAAYYHILETITVGDEPVVSGITGLRPWQEKASDFCYRARALGAIVKLVEGNPARRILLSYSDQGHVDLEPLADALSTFGHLSVFPLKEVGRYRPNRRALASGSAVTEYLMVLDRARPSSSMRRLACG